MPLLKEWTIGESGKAAIWKVEEPEAFFSEHTGLTPDIKHEKRRIEHLAGRFLLKHLDQGLPLHLIAKDEHDKPRLSNGYCHFSISHSFPFVAAVVDTRHETGIDVQTWNPRIGQIQHKFLSPQEQSFFEGDERLLTLAWCAKESVYKWHGRRGVDFRAHLPITAFDPGGEQALISIEVMHDNAATLVCVNSLLHDRFACAYVSR